MRWAGIIAVGMLAFGLSPGELMANDSMAMFGAGGLQFQQTNELRMTSEELYLSPLEVRVSYIFQNLTDHDVSGIVAFPLPEISVSQMSETPHEFHQSYLDGDIFDFQVEVGGRLIKPEADIHAFVKSADGIEKDVIGLLRKYRLPVVDPESAYGALDADAIKALVVAGVLMDDDVHHPLWSVRTIFHWVQIFPAGKTILIKHRYKPVFGSQHIGNEISLSDPRDYLAPWCPDKAFAAAVKALPADENAMLLATTLEYVLKTGANWAGPIGRFHLEIDKVGADLLTLCPIPGLKLQRRGQSFFAEASQYMPTSNIKILFAYRACDKAPCGINANWPGYPNH
jgi:hypothetical protein